MHPVEENLPPELAAAQARARRVPAWLRISLIVVAFAAAIYQIVAEVGITRWLIAIQLPLFDGYYVVPTSLVTFVVMLLPAVVVIQLLARVLR